MFSTKGFQEEGLKIIDLVKESSNSLVSVYDLKLKNEIEKAIAVSLLLRIASQLASSSSDLFEDGRAYAASALLRQLVEVEYLAWAFDTNPSEAQK